MFLLFTQPLYLIVAALSILLREYGEYLTEGHFSTGGDAPWSSHHGGGGETHWLPLLKSITPRPLAMEAGQGLGLLLPSGMEESEGAASQNKVYT